MHSAASTTLLRAFLALFLFSAESMTGRTGFQGFTASRNASGKGSWVEFKKQYVTPEGRVVDDANGGISHSEGQGYGMILAAANRDLAAFSVIWDWTRRNLGVREDGLFAWKWDPAAKGNPVTDPNNATDGDLLIAWALQRGGELWRNEKYIEEAKSIARTIRTSLIADSPTGPLLLPGRAGFTRDEGVVVNPSYWVFPAFLDLHRIDPSHLWKDLYLSGIRLARTARFGEWDLPPDWLLVTRSGELELPGDFDPVFGYNAVRIPLYLQWAGENEPDLYEPFEAWATSEPSVFQVPDQVNLETGEPGEFTVIPGMVSVYHLAAPLEVPAPGPPSDGFTSYYSACLTLLSDLAGREKKRYSELPRP
ncbi:MAG: glycosyl hydrolase family 8 [Puniceicoccaceae bacterium]